MSFLIDECLYESLIGVAHNAGFEAMHFNHLGLSGKPDWELAERIVKDEFTFVTSNRVDFIRLFGKVELHAGLVIIVPNAVPDVQLALFRIALKFVEGKDLINSVIEVTLKTGTVLLQPDAPETAVGRDFWASANPDSCLFNWGFPDPPHTLVFLSKPVQTDAEPITYVSHDIEDGAWQFLGPSMSGGDKPVISCFHHPNDKDPSLKELADLPLGWYAERAERDAPWVRRKHDEDSE